MDVKLPVNLTGTIFICHQLCNLIFDILPQTGMVISNIDNALHLTYNNNSRILFTGRGGQMERFIIKDISIIAPSVHKIDGTSAQMETCIKAETEDGTMVLYVCSLWNAGDSMDDRKLQWKLVEKFADQIPTTNNEATVHNVVTWSVTDLLPSDRSFYSFRTDPRTQFIVFTAPVIVPSQFYNNLVNEVVGKDIYDKLNALPIPKTAPENVVIFARNVVSTDGQENGEPGSGEPDASPQITNGTNGGVGGETGGQTGTGANEVEKCPADTGKVPAYVIVLWVLFGILVLIVSYWSGVPLTINLLISFVLLVVILIGVFISIPFMIALMVLCGIGIFVYFGYYKGQEIGEKVKKMGTSLAGILLPGIAIMRQGMSSAKVKLASKFAQFKASVKQTFKQKLQDLMDRYKAYQTQKKDALMQRKRDAMWGLYNGLQAFLTEIENMDVPNMAYIANTIRDLRKDIQNARKVDANDVNYNNTWDKLSSQLDEIESQLREVQMENINELPEEPPNEQPSEPPSEPAPSEPVSEPGPTGAVSEPPSEPAPSEPSILREMTGEEEPMTEEEQRNILRRANEARQQQEGQKPEQKTEPASTIYGAIPPQPAEAEAKAEVKPPQYREPKGKEKMVNVKSKEKMNKLDELNSALNTLGASIANVKTESDLEKYQPVVDKFKETIANATAINKSNKEYLSQLKKLNNRLRGFIPAQREKVKNEGLH